MTDIRSGTAVDPSWARWWEVHWKGKITRDVGWDVIRAGSASEALEIYEREHNYRRVTNVIEAN